MTQALERTDATKSGHLKNGRDAPPKLRLRFVGTLDFRHNDATQLDEIIKTLGSHLGKNECAFLVSKGGKILRVIFGVMEHEMVDRAGRFLDGHRTRVVASRTYRIVEGGVFNPYMLQNYANDMGFELAHLKKLEQHLKEEGA